MNNNTVLASYTHGPGIDDPLIMNYVGEDYFYHKNHLGSVVAITKYNQDIAKTYEYDAFGNILSETSHPGDPGHNAFTYTAREYHPRSGLYYYRARFYDPALGRFITQDPIGFLGGVNLYAYVGNDPIMLIDPLGLDEWLWGERAILRYGSRIFGYDPIPKESYGCPQKSGMEGLVTAALNVMLALKSSWLAGGAIAVEGLAAYSLYDQEQIYARSRDSLRNQIDAVGFLTDEEKRKLKNSIPNMSEAGYLFGQTAFGAWVGAGFLGAKHYRLIFK